MAYSSQSAYQSPRTNRSPHYDELPIGVGIIALVMGILGLLALLTGMVLLAAYVFQVNSFSFLITFMNNYVVSVGTFGGALMLIGGAATIAIASGLWHQEAWALWVCVVGLAVVEATLFFLSTPFSYIFIAILFLYAYLIAVRQHFR